MGVVAEDDGQVQVFMPTLTFLYTLDQLAGMLNMELRDFQYKHVWFHGITAGRKGRAQMVARNIAADNDTPDWRVTHQDFVRWLDSNGFKIRWPAVL